MTTPPLPRSVRPARAAALGLAALLLGVSPAASLAAGPVKVDQGPRQPSSESAIDLLKPIGGLLSGRPWLLTEGLDPSLLRRPSGRDTLTRLDWRALPGGLQSSSTQAAGAGAPVPYREPGPAFSRNLLVTRDFGRSTYQTEPHLTVNPDDPEHLVLGVIDYSFPAMSSYVSFDGGERWEGPFQVPYLVGDLVAGGDPVLDFDRDGSVYMNYISIGQEEFALGGTSVFAQVSSIAVARSDDDGFTWPVQVSTARSRVDTESLETDRFGRVRGTITAGFLDKPWLKVGPHPDDPERDVLYVTYTDFEIVYEILYIGEVATLSPTEMLTTIRLVRSEDAGETWSEPVDVSPTVRRAYGQAGSGEAPGVFGTARTVQGSQPVVSPDGTLHVAWVDSTDDKSQKGVGEIWVAGSEDTGATWSSPVVASVFNEPEFRARNAFFRYWASAFPQFAAGPDGELYIAYTGRPADKPNDDGDIYLINSGDGGETWSRPLRLNDDDTEHLQFFPSIDVGPDGALHAMWGDMRDDPQQTSYHIYYTRSDDGGETFGFEDEELGIRSGDTRVTDYASNPNYGFPYGLFIGDYFSLHATEDDVYMVWSDTRLGEFGGLNQKVAFARQTAVPSPEIFISPPAGPAGQEITLQGFDYQPDLDVYVQLGDSTISTLRTDQDGGFTARLFMPITSEGSQTLTVFDASGNGASTSYYTEFGFGNIADAIADLGERIDAVAPPAGPAPSGEPASDGS
jgi:hypothetical protein